MLLDLEDVQSSPFVSQELFFIKIPDINACVEVLMRFSQTPMTRESMAPSALAQLTKSVRRLQKLINGDLRLADHLSADVARSLVQILNSINYIVVERCCISILSRGRFDKCGNVIQKDALPLFVRLMNNVYPHIVVEVLIALTRLAYAHLDYIQVILNKGAQEAAQKNCSNSGVSYHNAIDNLAKFLVAVCRGVNLSGEKFTPNEISAIVTILDELFEKKLETIQHIVLACYAPSYLSLERNVPIENATIKKLIGFMSHVDNSVAGSALGVIGYVARWGVITRFSIWPKIPSFCRTLGLSGYIVNLRCFRRKLAR